MATREAEEEMHHGFLNIGGKASASHHSVGDGCIEPGNRNFE